MESPEHEEGNGAESRHDVADEPAEDEPTVRLTGGIDLTQLRDGETFEVQEESFQEDIRSQYSPEEVYDHLNPRCLHADGSDDEENGNSFEKKEAEMTDLTGDKGVMKRVVRNGFGDNVPEAAFVQMLYDVELLDFTDTMGFDEYFSLSAAEKREAPFEIVSKVVDKDRKDGNELFARGNRWGAMKKYKRAVRQLQECRLGDAEEETERNKLMIRTSLNLALCFLKENEPKKCLGATNEVIYLDRNNAKAFYLRGKALIELAEFDKAKQALLKAKELKPRDQDIYKAFQYLEMKFAKLNMQERKLAQAMMGMTADGKAPNHDSLRAPYTEKDKDNIRDEIRTFVEDEDLQSVPLPMRVWSEGEIRCVKDVAAEFNIHVDHVGKDSNARYVLRKPSKPEIEDKM